MNEGGIDSGLALLPVEEHFVGGALRERGDDFARPIGIILTLSEDHFSEAVLINHRISYKLVNHSINIIIPVKFLTAVCEFYLPD